MISRQNKMSDQSSPVTKLSQYKGVHWRYSRWRAQIYAQGETFPLGDYSKEEDAAAAYDRALISKLGYEHAETNLPKQNYKDQASDLIKMMMPEVANILLEESEMMRQVSCRHNKLSVMKSNNGSATKAIQRETDPRAVDLSEIVSKEFEMMEPSSMAAEPSCPMPHNSPSCLKFLDYDYSQIDNWLDAVTASHLAEKQAKKCGGFTLEQLEEVKGLHLTATRKLNNTSPANGPPPNVSTSQLSRQDTQTGATIMGGGVCCKDLLESAGGGLSPRSPPLFSRERDVSIAMGRLRIFLLEMCGVTLPSMQEWPCRIVITDFVREARAGEPEVVISTQVDVLDPAGVPFTSPRELLFSMGLTIPKSHTYVRDPRTNTLVDNVELLLMNWNFLVMDELEDEEMDGDNDNDDGADFFDGESENNEHPDDVQDDREQVVGAEGHNAES
ncbi:hypothetical protein CEUSTIGMA_g7676.t1 [Chlamydomonas eustigma]|uniref:AP2/ERF domain-containing protein n=1 Tax=Chlamydomonas eustigma TaxID=1157962 RepID=A0A250XAX6_9CHLO|nr:hypothetical protein CEUSTIGMA_g7676.t1 [Chlamydomonas eustigma]|eukprot:GAX80238.1 hypothetical protein CEUSTIGMA_g7676.t1 [Chlamydomonas eustigma]